MNDTLNKQDGRRKGRRYSKQQQLEVIRGYEESGQTQVAFCATHGLSKKSLSRWLRARRRLRFAAFDVPLVSAAPFELIYPNGVRLSVRPISGREECVALLRELAGC